IGLADSILRQIGGAESSASAAPTRYTGLRGGWSSGTGAAEKLAAARAAGGSAERTVEGDPSPEDFVAAALPHARRAAAALDVPVEVIVAQAALETGWGRHMMRDDTGASAFNVFGIKATTNWTGERAVVPTLEFVNGIPERRSE